MVKIHSEKELLTYLAENTGLHKDQNNKTFIEGAKFAFNLNQDYINLLLNKIERQRKKIDEYSLKIADFEETYYGVDAPGGRRSRRKATPVKRDEESMDELMDDMRKEGLIASSDYRYDGDNDDYDSQD